MAIAGESPFYLDSTVSFVQVCSTLFGWGDLSEDTVLDLGCGHELACARNVLRNFPKVKSIIALDGSSRELQKTTFKSPQITEVCANILNRVDIRQYEGKVDKVISTHVLEEILNKEKVFKNVYRLLKPGGEAAFLFKSDFGMYHILPILRQDPRFEAYFQDSYFYTLNSRELKADNYKEMLGKIGFQVIKIGEEKDNFPIECFERFENGPLYGKVLQAFSVPPTLVPIIKESASHHYRGKFCDQESFYGATNMSIFVAKPCESDTRCYCS